MKCPKCDNTKVRYVEQRNKKVHKKLKLSRRKALRKVISKHMPKPGPRTNFEAYCNKCKFKGDVM